MATGRSVNTLISGGAILFTPPPSEEKETSPQAIEQADTHLSITTFLDQPDRDFLRIITSMKIPTYGEKIASGASTIATYLSFLLFLNSARNFPLIQHKIYNELHSILYYRCVLDPQIATNLELEAATVGTEAVGYTTALAGVGLVAATLISAVQLGKFIHTLRLKKYFRDLLTTHELDIKKNVWMFALSNKELGKLIVLIESKIAVEREVVEAIIKIYFHELSAKELRELNSHIETYNLRLPIINDLTITPTPWRRFVTKSQWFAGEISRYRIPVASLFAIPGFAVMLRESNILGEKINCYIDTLAFDNCEVDKQYDQLTMEIWLWMAMSFPVIGLTSMSMMVYLLLQNSRFKNFRTGIYDRIHRPYARWCDDPRWVYKNLAVEILGIFVRPAIVIYSFTKASLLVNQYADRIGCQSFWHVLTAGFFANDDYNCTASNRSIALSSFVSDSEIAKFYFFSALFAASTYTLAHFIEKCTSLTRRLPVARAQKIYNEFLQMNKRSLSYALSGRLIIPLGVALFFIARRFSEQFLMEGDTKVISLNFDINQNISSITNSSFLDRLCPYDNLTALVNGNYQELNTIGYNLINNNTIQITNAPPCEESIIWLALQNLMSIDSECSPLVQYRGLAFFITVFWMMFSLTVYGVYLTASEIQTLPWLFSHTYQWLCSNGGNEDVELDLTAESEREEEEFKRISEENHPHLERFLHIVPPESDEEKETSQRGRRLFGLFPWSRRAETPEAKVTLPTTSRYIAPRFDLRHFDD